LLGAYDVLGFQTETDATNICRCFGGECGVHRIGDGTFDFAGRHVAVDVYPVGVETEAFERLGRRTIGSGFAREVVESLSGRGHYPAAFWDSRRSGSFTITGEKLGY